MDWRLTRRRLSSRAAAVRMICLPECMLIAACSLLLMLRLRRLLLMLMLADRSLRVNEDASQGYA